MLRTLENYKKMFYHFNQKIEIEEDGSTLWIIQCAEISEAEGQGNSKALAYYKAQQAFDETITSFINRNIEPPLPSGEIPDDSDTDIDNSIIENEILQAEKIIATDSSATSTTILTPNPNITMLAIPTIGQYELAD